jgi:hypothetical protein
VECFFLDHPTGRSIHVLGGDPGPDRTERLFLSLLNHAVTGSTARLVWRLVEKKAALGLEMIKRMATLSTLMAVLAILLFLSIVLGYI